METKYKIGLVAQNLTDAGPGGLSVEELADITKLTAEEVSRILGLCLANGHAEKIEGRYRAR